MTMAWYTVTNIDTVDTPAVLIFPDRVEENIRRMIGSIDDIARLRPHVKTHKSDEVSQLMLAAGIQRFKCATIAEAEMLAEAGARDILLAYQPVGPKAIRFVTLVKQYPDITWACLVDTINAARDINTAAQQAGVRLGLYIDLNVGMNRTGITPPDAPALITACLSLSHVYVAGLHAYDGHLRDPDLAVRRKQCDEAFAPVLHLQQQMATQHQLSLTVVAGGTPSFSIHRERAGIQCSPGTYIYWDKGYEQILPEQQYLHAAVVATRIISRPQPDLICTDLGHKAIASENPLNKRVVFLHDDQPEPVGHSEEHMVFRVKDPSRYQVGDVLYGIPYHVCPTIALHDQPVVVRHGAATGTWHTRARDRKLRF